VFIRKNYLKKIQPFIDKPVIKIITGMRRTGKSYFLRQIINGLIKNQQVNENHILYINKESMAFDFIKDEQDLYHYVRSRFGDPSGEKKYLFIDEVQEISGWEKAVTSFFGEGNFDIFISGSNAHLLSSDLATLLSGRYIEFPIYSLSFGEFLLFRADTKGSDPDEFFNYLKYGGFPAIHHFGLEEEITYQYVSALYNTILLKDVIKKNNIRNVTLLENLANYLFENVGNLFSARKISAYLKSQRLSVGVETVQNYISYLCSTFVLHKVPRYDLKGKRILEIQEKYYLGDIGIRHAVLGYREADISGILENIVYLELRRRGYKVYIGKWEDKEIDFIAIKSAEKIYIQVAYQLSSRETRDREFSTLAKIKDNYPKYVISMDTALGQDFNGIKRIHIIDFLLRP